MAGIGQNINLQPGAANVPRALEIWKIGEVVVWLVFNSPMLIAFLIVFLSLIFQNLSGLVYLGVLIISCFLRWGLYSSIGIPEQENQGEPICSSIKYSVLGNSSFSSFIFAFTFMYLGLPMFLRSDVNYWVLVPLIVYWLMDIITRVWKGCVSSGPLIGNIVLGAFVSSMSLVAIYSLGGEGLLIFNEVSSSKEICSQPSEQTFKCSVFKDGELVANI
jgi:hypothetical protein